METTYIIKQIVTPRNRDTHAYCRAFGCELFSRLRCVAVGIRTLDLPLAARTLYPTESPPRQDLNKSLWRAIMINSVDTNQGWLLLI